MKNAKRSLSFILCITQIVICAAVMIVIAHDLMAYANSLPQWILHIREDADTTRWQVLLVVFNLSLLVSVISLIYVIKWDSANGLVGWGIASIFLLNFGAGVSMVLGAHQLSYRVDSKRKLAIVFALGQLFLAAIIFLYAFTIRRVVPGYEASAQGLSVVRIVAMVLALTSIAITIPSLILSISSRNPKGLLVMGVLSIFLLNLGCGVMMILKAPEVQAFLDAKAAR